ncbi:MAG: OmpA family protein [Polyangia bacterium]
MRRIILLGLVLSACGVPQELYNTRSRELDRCHADLTRTQSDYNAAQKNADDLATDASDLRERLSALQSDHQKAAQSLAVEQKNLESYKKDAVLAQKRADLLRDLQSHVQPLVDKKQVVVEEVKGRILLRIQEASLFDTGHAELRPDGQELLHELATVMKQLNRDVLVACHTDNQPVKNSQFGSAWELTLARSVAVVRDFQGEGVDPRRLGAAGYSEFNYLTDNSDEAGRAQNRRVELIVMPTQEELLPLPPLAVAKPAPAVTKPVPAVAAPAGKAP